MRKFLSKGLAGGTAVAEWGRPGVCLGGRTTRPAAGETACATKTATLQPSAGPKDSSGRLAACLLCLLAALLSACGYHVAGNTIPNPPPAANAKDAKSAPPLNIRTIAIPAFTTNQARPKLTRLLATNIAQEFINRTKYEVIADPAQADVVLRGSLANFGVFQTISDPTTGRATGAQIIATLQITLTERATGKVLFSRSPLEFRERYEISTDPQTYFDESGTAVERVARDAARTVVTAILENF